MIVWALGIEFCLGIKVGTKTLNHGQKRVRILHIDKGRCPFDRVLPEQTAVTWIKSVPVWLRLNQFQVLDYSELAGT